MVYRFYCMVLFHSQMRCHMIKHFLSWLYQDTAASSSINMSIHCNLNFHGFVKTRLPLFLWICQDTATSIFMDLSKWLPLILWICQNTYTSNIWWIYQDTATTNFMNLSRHCYHYFYEFVKTLLHVPLIWWLCQDTATTIFMDLSKHCYMYL